MATTAAYLTTSAKTQAIEDRLHKIAERFETPSGAPGGEVAAALAAIDEALLELDVPIEEWDILYRSRLQVERDALAGTRRRGLPAPGATATLAADPAGHTTPALTAPREATG